MRPKHRCWGKQSREDRQVQRAKVDFHSLDRGIDTKNKTLCGEELVGDDRYMLVSGLRRM